MNLSNVRVKVHTLVSLLVSGDFDTVASMTSGRLSGGEIEAAIEEYGRRLIPLPAGWDDLLDIIPIAGPQPSRLSVRVPLWTAEEGRSDLELWLTMSEIVDGVYEAEVDGIHVP